MKKIVLKHVTHRNSPAYAIIFDYDPELNELAHSIKDVQYSGSKGFWYVESTEEKLRDILRAFRNRAEIDISAISNKSIPLNAEDSNDSSETPVTKEVESDTKPESYSGHESDSHPQTSLKNVHIDAPGRQQLFGPVEFGLNARDGRLMIKFLGRYDQGWVDEIRSYGRIYYDAKHKEFLLPWSKMTVDSLSDYFTSKGIAVRVLRSEPAEAIKELRRNAGEELRSKELSLKAIEGIELLRRYLEESRYSYRTIETYLSLLEQFFRYFSEKDPYLIKQGEVSSFMNDFVIKNGFSASYQNQAVSAIKLFYEVSGKGMIRPHFLERPRRGRALPKVFSKEEITRILNASGNNKHKLLLWIIYSCGLRRSEVTNILLSDIDRGRSIIHIREAKGNVDRIVPVSDKVLKKLDEYLESYHPGRYLFEGQRGGRYSVESVYNVFRKALKKAGIKRDVGVHSLRHSYATHLHESGLDIRYIQELLGHKSTRTTEIYTHVSRRNLIMVRSPIEDIDLK